ESGGEGDRREPPPVTPEGVGNLKGVRVPHEGDPGAAARGEVAAVGAVVETVDRRLFVDQADHVDGANLAAGVEVPDRQGVDPVARRDLPGARAEGDTGDAAGSPGEGPDLLARGVPELHGPVVAGGSDQPAVRAPGHRV